MYNAEQQFEIHLRNQCLQYALGLHPEGAPRDEVLHTAECFYLWLKPKSKTEELH